MAETKRRRFRVAVKTGEFGTGIGIQEWGGRSDVIYIGSLYIAGQNDFKHGLHYSVQHIKRMIGTDSAIIRVSGRVKWYSPPVNIKLRNVENYASTRECVDLANDALQRKNTIEERF